MKKRSALSFAAGVVVGGLLIAAFMLAFPGKRNFYRLTADLDLASTNVFADSDGAVQGQIRKGSELEVVSRKGNVDYVSFGTAIEHDKLMAIVRVASN